jgi:CSLREA domain-containing protein
MPFRPLRFPFRLVQDLPRRTNWASATLLGAFLLSSGPVAAATIVVDTLDDTDLADGLCSLREALLAAESNAPHNGCSAGAGDEDVVEIGLTGSIHVVSNLPTLHHDLTVVGPHTGTLTIDGDAHRLFVLNGDPDGATLRIVRLTLRDGFNAAGGGCITVREGDHLEVEDSRILQCESLESGGGIYGDLAASMSIVRSSVQSNLAEGGGGIYLLGQGYAAAPFAGGQPTAVLSVVDSTIQGNESPPNLAGGGLAIAFAHGAIQRSTISGNSSGDAGGGLVLILGTLVVENSTITLNLADSDADATVEAGGGIFLLGLPELPTTLALHNTVVAANRGGNLSNDVAVDADAALVSAGFNLVGVREGAAASLPLGQPNLLDDWIGSRAEPLDAGLDPLDDNGGPTRTHAPGASSLLVDHGECPGELRDQRSFGNAQTQLRPTDNPAVGDSADGCDIGAVESGASILPLPGFFDSFESGDTGAWSAAIL